MAGALTSENISSSRCNKDLWVLISGVSVLKSKAVVETELQKSTTKLLDGLTYYKKPSTASYAALSKEKKIDGAQLEFIQKLSKFLDLDELQCYDIFCLYLLYEYKGSQRGLQSCLAVDRHMQALMLEIWNYYHSERIYLLLCVKHIVSHWLDSSHPYSELYKSFIEPLKDSDLLMEKLLAQFEMISGIVVPAKDTHGQLMNESQISKWASYRLKEQCELLQTMLLYHKDMECNVDMFRRQLKVFQKHGFGRRQSFRNFLDDASEVLLETISQLEALIVIENMELEWLSECQNNNITAHYLFKEEAIWKQVDELVCSSFGLLVEHSPVVLGWMLVRYMHLQGQDLAVTKQLGNCAVQHNVFKYLHKILSQPFFSSSSVLSNLAHTVVYGLVSTLLSTFQVETLGKIEDLQALAILLLRHSNISQDVWTKGFELGVGQLVYRAVEGFPYDFHTLLKLLTSVASSSGVEYEKIVELLENLPCFTQRVDGRSIVLTLTEDENTCQLSANHVPLNSENIIIPRGTTGRILEQSDKFGQLVIQWDIPISGLDIARFEARNLLKNLAYGAGQVSEEMILKVLDVAHLVSSIIKNSLSAIGKLCPIIDQLQLIFQRFCIIPNPPMTLLAACMEVMAHIAQDKPVEMWQCLSQIGIMPFVSKVAPEISKLSSGLDMNVGILGSLLAAQECVTGNYPLTMAFLKLMNYSVEVMLEHGSNTFLASEVFLLQEIFPYFHKWRYRQQKDREHIGKGCLNVIHKLLSLVYPDGSPCERSLPQQVCIHSLLYNKAGEALLLLVATGDETIQTALNQQTSWFAGTGSELIDLVRLALSVLNRLLLLKSPVNTKESSMSPMESILCSQPVHPTQPHIVLIVAHYGFHRFDPRLAILAIMLLKRFARELNISILACLGNDADAIRDAYLIRLEAATEDVRLKIALLEFLTVCVAAQPGLLEMFINIPFQSTVSKELLGKDQPSCLQSVLDILKERKEGIHFCPDQLHCAAVEFLHALWVGWRNVAICLLKQNSSFWVWLCDPLVDEAQIGKTVQVAAYIMKIVSLEIYHHSLAIGASSDEGLQSVLKKLTSGSHLTRWSEVVQNTIASAEKFDSNSLDTSLNPLPTTIKTSLLVLAAWKDFLTVLAKNMPKSLSTEQKQTIARDLMETLIEQSLDPANPKLLGLLSATSLLVLHHWKSDSVHDWETWSTSIGSLLSHISSSQENVSLSVLVSVTSFAACFLQILQSNKSRKISDLSLAAWVPSVCVLVKLCTTNLEKIVSSEDRSARRQLPMSCICLLRELIAYLEQPSLWLPSLLQHLTVNCVLSLMAVCMKGQKAPDIVSSMLVFLLSLAAVPESAQVLSSSDMMQHICLPLSFTYSNLQQSLVLTAGNMNVNKKEISPWFGVYQTALKLVMTMLKTQKHFFFDDALNFVGVHMDRMLLSLMSVQVSLNPHDLHTTLVTLNFINELSCSKESWQLRYHSSLKTLMGAVCSVSQASIAFLIRPNFIQHLLEHHPRHDGQVVLEEERQRIRRLSSTEDVDKPSPQLLSIQTKLLQIVSVSLSVLRHFTPNLCEILLDQGIDTSQWEPVLACGFSTPAIDQDTPVNFGSMVSCVNVCLRALTKNERAPSPGRTAQTESSLQVDRQLLLFVLENALVLLMSQALLYLLSPSLTSRDKQLIKRELGAELNSFAMSMNRYLRRGTFSHSPAASLPSPGQGEKQSSPGYQPFVRLITSLVDKLFK